ncbi:RNA-binding protein [Streptomyces tateyamensis]|uniref:RNA-binding protein n=1 Tax=Streptomyces tateyamensis TaxID=565073 RepID=A0A2V4NQU3_9ACTN|nr:RNA-binding S4 domain-containing protein [Streptomyces tateyamensis]PYC78563.1 RNA-binding protein [Streptomyces tateyamensis]
MAVDEGSTTGSARVDAWIWAVRLAKTRSAAAADCRAGHVRVNGERAKPAQALRVGDEVRVRQENWDRVVIVSRLISKRVGASVAVECYVDKSLPRPTGDQAGMFAVRDRGAGRPTKQDRRALDKVLGARQAGRPSK